MINTVMDLLLAFGIIYGVFVIMYLTYRNQMGMVGLKPKASLYQANHWLSLYYYHKARKNHVRKWYYQMLLKTHQNEDHQQ